VKVPVLGTVAAVVVSAVAAALLGGSPGQLLLLALAVLAGCTVVAYRTVASTLAGVALLVIRPYAQGERVRILSPVDGCLIEAVVVHVGIANTTLASDTGVLVVPNNRLLRNPPLPAPPRASACAPDQPNG
jgi:small-conductance mechanosensitive channel